MYRIFLGSLVGLLAAILAGCQGVATPESPSSSPSSVASYSLLEREVTVGEHALKATLVAPAGGHQIAVLLLAGSGPQDQDETLPGGAKPLRDIATALGEHGITTLRFNKRTFQERSVDPTTFTVRDEYLDDAAAGIALLRQELPGAAIFVAGHSQGAMVLPTVLAENPEVTGGISLAGTPRSLWAVLLDQNRRQLAADSTLTQEQRETKLAELEAAIAQLEAVDSAEDPVPMPFAQYLAAPYIASLNSLDPVATAQGLDKPLLFLQGEADKQIFADVDYLAWQEAMADEPQAQFQLLPGLSHYFAVSTGTTALEDLNSTASVAPEATEAMATWLLSQAP